MPRLRMKVLSKSEWGGQPTRMDIAGEVMEEVELPAKYVVISATCSRPCVALEDCAIAMKTYQQYFLRDGLPDVPFNFMVGPGRVALEGRGWHSNCVQFKEEGVDDVCVWNSITEVRGFTNRIEDIKKLMKALGFKKPESEEENMNKTLSQIKKKRFMESIGRSNKHDKNRYFGKTIKIGLISDVFYHGNPSQRAVSSAVRLIKYGIRNNYISQQYRLGFTFDPLYKLRKITTIKNNPLGLFNPHRMIRKSRLDDFVEDLMIPSMLM